MIYISPPFGTYFRPAGSIPVLGSFTLEPRPGRTGQVLRTLRPVPDGWVNAIGLRNPGVESLRYTPGVVYSIAGIDPGDWEKLRQALRLKVWPKYQIELNLSCPNVHEYGPPSLEVLRSFAALPSATISAKMPPDINKARKFTDRCLRAGIRLIHLSNTLPSPVGGISGLPLFEVNIGIVQSIVANNWDRGLEVIAGGGIHTTDQAQAYQQVGQQAGACHISMGTVWMNPVRGYRLYRQLVAKGFNK